MTSQRMLVAGLAVLFIIVMGAAARAVPIPRVRTLTTSAHVCGTSCGARQGGLSVWDPLTNIREITVQSILVEQHLTSPGWMCRECVKKHLRHCEGLAAEALTLDLSGRYWSLLAPLPPTLRAWEAAFLDGGRKAEDIAQEIRALRKRLMAVEDFAVRA